MSSADATRHSDPLAVGAKVGNYEVLALLGAGGMGEVYRVRDTRLGREVALKLLPAGHTHDVSARDLAEREARIVASLMAPPPLVTYLALAVLLVTALLLVTGRLSPSLPSSAKGRPYESGVSEPITTQTRWPVRFAASVRYLARRSACANSIWWTLPPVSTTFGRRRATGSRP